MTPGLFESKIKLGTRTGKRVVDEFTENLEL